MTYDGRMMERINAAVDNAQPRCDCEHGHHERDNVHGAGACPNRSVGKFVTYGETQNLCAPCSTLNPDTKAKP